MLAPKKLKYRKKQKGRIKGPAVKGSTIAFGDVALKTLERQVVQPADRGRPYAIMRHIKRGGKVWIRMFPDYR